MCHHIFKALSIIEPDLGHIFIMPIHHKYWHLFFRCPVDDALYNLAALYLFIQYNHGIDFVIGDNVKDASFSNIIATVAYLRIESIDKKSAVLIPKKPVEFRNKSKFTRIIESVCA